MSRWVFLLMLQILIEMTSSFALAKIYSDPAQVPNPTLTSGTFVSNPDGILTSKQTSELQTLIAKHHDRTTNEIAVVIIEKLEGWAPKDLAHRLFNLRGEGKKGKDNGLLILVVTSDRRIEFEIGYGVEGILPDILCKRIQLEYMVPRFKEGRIYDGLHEGIKQVINTLENPKLQNQYLPDSSNEQKIASFDKDQVTVLLFFFGLTLLIFGVVFANAVPNAVKSNPKIIVLGSLYSIWYLGAGFIAGPNWPIACFIILSVNLFAFFIDRLQMRMILKGQDPIRRSEFLKKLCSSGWGGLAASTLPIAWTISWIKLKKQINEIRYSPMSCPKCQGQCEFVPQKEEAPYLTKADIREEHIGSANYDVWMCKACTNPIIVVIPAFFYEYELCSQCQRHGLQKTGLTMTVEPTYSQQGSGIESYSCKICDASVKKTKIFPQLLEESRGTHGRSSFGGTSGSSSSGGSSGSSSSSFGGGRSGGGGSGSSW